MHITRRIEQAWNELAINSNNATGAAEEDYTGIFEKAAVKIPQEQAKVFPPSARYTLAYNLPTREYKIERVR